MTSGPREGAIGFAGLLPVLSCFDWGLERTREEVAVIAYHFHWSRAECMALSKNERAAWLGEIRRINKEIARSLKGRKK